MFKRLAMAYKPFWDVDNGKTLCEDCHKIITFKKGENLCGNLAEIP
jgi:hypothetical protein